MDENLISKKELLRITGISYGQLYRWKRKKLIPENWFIKKSTYTGQETFLPRKDVLERVEKIKNFKGDISLDDLADIFSPDLSKISLFEKNIIDKKIVSQITINIYKKIQVGIINFCFQDLLFMVIAEKFLKSGEANVDEISMILSTLKKNYNNFEGKYCDIMLIRKLGIAFCMILLSPNKFSLDKDSKLAFKVNTADCLEELKTKLQ